MGERCVPNLIVIYSTINQLECKVSQITTHCLRLFVVVYRVEILLNQRQWRSYTRANPGLARVKFALDRVKFALAHVKISTQYHAQSRPSHCAR